MLCRYIIKYNPNSNEIGTLCKTDIKPEYMHLQILFNLYSIKYTTKTINLMFKLINLIVFCKYCLTLNLMPATRFKKAGTGNKRLGKLRNAQKTPVWNIPQVNRLTGNK